MSDGQVRASLYTICIAYIRGFDASYCQTHAMPELDEQGCIYALSVSIPELDNFLIYADIFGVLEPSSSASFVQSILPFIYLGVMLSCGAALLLGLPFVRGK